MLSTIAPKSDQQNADNLIGGPRTITVTKVHLTGEGDQPVAVYFEGDEGKPFKPCKTCRRIMVHIWGPDASQYAGRSMTIYRDDKVMFGGVAVGGIRISHMSHIEKDVTMALTTTRAQRKPFTVKPLRVETKPAEFDARVWATAFRAKLHEYDNAMALRLDYAEHSDKLSPSARKFMDDAVDERANELGIPDDDPENDFPDGQ